MTVKKSALITARELPKLVDAAVADAVKRTKIHPETGHVLINWDLMGIIIRDTGTLPDGGVQHFAEAVAKNINTAGHDVVPAVLTIDKRIIAGFWERVALPQIREF